MVERQINLDYERQARTGLDEAILCEGKSVAQIDTILRDAASTRAPLLLTRLSAPAFDALAPTHGERLDYDPVSRTAFFGRAAPKGPDTGMVAVVTAGTSDVPVGREAVRTLHYCGITPLEIYDVGVAGLWRLLDRVGELRTRRVIIVAAGMDGALPTVLCGLVPGAVVAVPTSVGYGVSDGGRAALNAALASCASGLLTVNIDNGFGAACAAMRILGPGAGRVAEQSRADPLFHAER